MKTAVSAETAVFYSGGVSADRVFLWEKEEGNLMTGPPGKTGIRRSVGFLFWFPAAAAFLRTVAQELALGHHILIDDELPFI